MSLRIYRTVNTGGNCMNFGPSGLDRQRTELGSSAPMYRKKAGILALRIFLVSLLFVLAASFFLILGAYRGIIDGSPDIEDVNIIPAGYATFAYDSDGNELQKLTSASGNRISVSIGDIPLNMQHAIVAIEDSRFYEHNGIDPHGMLRAALVAVRSGFSRTEGASTITQQLLKNNVFTDFTKESRLERIKRKLQEQFLAVQLEDYLAKKGEDAKSVILENYLNTINFGAGSYGIQTASITYFGKDCKDLTLAECAVLASIPQNPSKWNPRNHPEQNALRAKTVLKYMLNQKYITQQEYDAALAEDVYTKIQQHKADQSTNDVYSYFIDELIHQVKTDLMNQKGYTEVQANNAIFSGGLQIYTTQDSQVQKIMDEEFTNEANFPSRITIALDWALTVKHADGTRQNFSREMLQLHFRNFDKGFDLLFDSKEKAQSYVDKYKETILQPGDEIIGERTSFTPQPQSSMCVMDQSNGYVRGLIGGRGKKEASLTLNRATDTYRQPGSTFKILSTYGPALNDGDISLATTVADEPYNYANGQPVKNADNQYHGLVTIRKAIERSYNIVAVKTLTEITPQRGFDYLQKLGFKKLVNSTKWDVIQPLALGGITNGVSNLELTAAYAAIANHGTYTAPIFYTKVTDHEGKVLLENTPVTNEVFKDSTAALLTSAMQDVMTKGTGRNFNLSGMHVAGKTGTTNSYRDLVFAGFTPYYTAAIWAGCDVTVNLPQDYRTFHQGLWRKVMQRIHSDKKLQDKNFEMPASVKKVTVCSESGLLPRAFCPRITEYFDVANVPKQKCNISHYIPPIFREETTETLPNTQGETQGNGDTGTETPSTGEQSAGGDTGGGGDEGTGETGG